MWFSRKKEALERARGLEKESIPEQEDTARQYKEDLQKEIQLAKLLKDDWYLHGNRPAVASSRRKPRPKKKAKR